MGSRSTTAGPAVCLTGNGSGFGYCEQIVILALTTAGAITDVIQVNASPAAANVNTVTVGFSRFLNYTGKALNNVAQGSNLFLVGNMSVTGSGSVTGTVYCLANIGISDSMAALTVTGKATVSGGAAVTGGTTTDTLAVEGTSTFTGAATINGGAAVAGGLTTDTLTAAGFIANGYVVEKTWYVNFPNGVTNQKVDIVFGNVPVFGAFEIAVTGCLDYQNTLGKIKKLFAVGANPDNLIYTNQSVYTEVIGNTAVGFAIGNFSWDAVNLVYRVQIAHLNGLGNPIGISLRALVSVDVSTFEGAAVGAIYTTDVTVFPTPSVSFTGGVEVAGPTLLDTTLAVTGASTFTGKTTHNGGAAVTNGTTTDTLSISGSFAQTGVAQAVSITDPTTAANWRTALGVTTGPKAQLFSPLDKGAVGNGSADDTIAINAAISAYGYLYLPPGYSFNTSTGVTVTTAGLQIFGGGELQTSSASPTLTLNGTSSSGIPGIIIEGVAINRYGTTAAPAILVENVYNLTIDRVAIYNGDGPAISLVGNGSGFAYCEQITITRVAVTYCSDGVQINSTGGGYNVNSVSISSSRFANYTGFAVNNVAQGAELYIAGCVCIPGSGGGTVYGTVGCYGNCGIPDSLQ